MGREVSILRRFFTFSLLSFAEMASDHVTHSRKSKDHLAVSGAVLLLAGFAFTEIIIAE